MGKNKQQLVKCINHMFYLPTVPEEKYFVEQMTTRGTGSKERHGLHASDILNTSKKDMCIRKLVLSIFYKRKQEENINTDLKKTYEHGNFVHEMFQRMFLRAGYSMVEDLDRTRLWNGFLSYSIDINATIPEVFKGATFPVEIKSQKSRWFYEQPKHTKAEKQLALYMYTEDVQNGVVLVFNKDTDEIRLTLCERNDDVIKDEIDILEIVYEYYAENRIPTREGRSIREKKCLNCYMRDACYDLGKGKQLI